MVHATVILCAELFPPRAGHEVLQPLAGLRSRYGGQVLDTTLLPREAAHTGEAGVADDTLLALWLQRLVPLTDSAVAGHDVARPE